MQTSSDQQVRIETIFDPFGKTQFRGRVWSISSYQTPVVLYITSNHEYEAVAWLAAKAWVDDQKMVLVSKAVERAERAS